VLKIVGVPNQYLHFCGIKIWGLANDDTCNPEPEPEPVKEPEPEPPKIKEPEAGIIIPANLTFKTAEVTMSSKWKDERMKPWNPIKVTQKFNPNWGGGKFTCIHTMNDAEGAWWKV
jgi:hypothetical protein